MCGIAGFLTVGGEAGTLEAIGRAMVATLNHRGPDDRGLWCDPDSGIVLTQARLSIVDLSPAGHQPMVSHGGGFVIVFNGEIYNHADLRERIGHRPWRGHSDTETLLAAIEAWGLALALERCRGMFAFALWDLGRRTLTLGRDRMGEKPLYYGWQGQGERRAFLFGSELKALRAHPAWQARLDRGALALFMRHNYVPGPWSIHEGIGKLPPGHLLEVSLARPDSAPRAYWSTAEVARSGAGDVFRGDADQLVDELEALLKHAVAQQMVADVPLGAFLSGGIDSSTIVALMQAQSPRPVKTFTIGFNEAGYNEAEHAKAVARHLGTDHTELYVSPEQAMAVVPRLPALYDEPFADSSQIPTFLVAQLARSRVTVSLSGDGGDELFAGYTRYAVTQQVWHRLQRLPRPLRRLAARALLSVPPRGLDAVGNVLSPLLPPRLRLSAFGDKVHKGAARMGARSVDELYLGLVSHWDEPARLVIGGEEHATTLTGLRPPLEGLDDVQRMMALDAVSYLPDDILVKVDRAAMGVSLETRVPLLDPRVVAFAWRLPMHCKLRDGTTKWALRQVLYRHVPQALVERPKMGFGVPIDQWLRGALRGWAEALLDESRLRREGYLDPAPVRRLWADHLSGRRNGQYLLWDVLMFQAWLEAQATTPAGAS